MKSCCFLQAELVHSRWAMAAVAGILVQVRVGDIPLNELVCFAIAYRAQLDAAAAAVLL